MRTLLCIFAVFQWGITCAQLGTKTFELRYFTEDSKADGATDFKGEKEWMKTDQRIRFLKDYTEYASRFFGDENLDKRVVSDEEIAAASLKIKSQPLTNIRQTIPLKNWKTYGYRCGETSAKESSIKKWIGNRGIRVEDGNMIMQDAFVKRMIDSLNWRFRFDISIEAENGEMSVLFCNNKKEVISVKVNQNEITVFSSGKTLRRKTDSKSVIKNIEIEGDFTQKKFNLLSNGRKLFDYISMGDTTVNSITDFVLKNSGKVKAGHIFLMNYTPQDNVRVPYVSSVVMDEDFEEKPGVEGWQKYDFDDSQWSESELPSVHGGIREKDEDYYLRKKIQINNFERAILKFETIDPGGEVWVNDHVVAVINTRRPVRIDVTKYIKANSENIIAVRVNPYELKYPMGHTPSDHFTGWFLGRGSLALTKGRSMIRNVFVTTEQIGDTAVQLNKVILQRDGRYYKDGSLEINYYPWFPEEKEKIASIKKNIAIRPGIINDYNIKLSIPHPRLWNCSSPFLYRVEVILRDKEGKAMDDFMTTTGIRTIEQKNGDLFINGKRDMLNGAQIMGFRTPIETISKTSRCAFPSSVIEELLMIKKMGGNLLRMHVHAERDTTEGINDPRYAEFADQLGLYLIWQTASWERQSDAWHVDFEGYPQYMRQVYNHPSIVMWEAANHPNRFQEHDLSDTQDYMKRIYDVISSADTSRLISPTSYWSLSYYGNYDGTKDFKGRDIKEKIVPEIMAKNNTRGSQDAYTGYGKDWSVLRKAPNPWAASCLNAHDKAYFNFEHEESIGQPNWNLCKGKPWYHMASYEWYYDKGSIGRNLTTAEWRESQGWQAFSAWESMKKQVFLGYDGFSWCTLHGGANMGTYKKPLIDNLGHAKLAFYTNKMVFQSTWIGSDDVDVVYGPEDNICPEVNHIGETEKVDVIISLKTIKGKTIDEKKFKGVTLQGGHSFTKLKEFRFKRVPEGVYAIEYEVKR